MAGDECAAGLPACPITVAHDLPPGNPLEPVTAVTARNKKRNTEIPCAAVVLSLLLRCYIYTDRNIYIEGSGKA
jgi:hypothetical protein